MFEKNQNSISVVIMHIRREESSQRTKKGKYKPAVETKAESRMKTRDQKKYRDHNNQRPTIKDQRQPVLRVYRTTW